MIGKLGGEENTAIELALYTVFPVAKGDFTNAMHFSWQSGYVAHGKISLEMAPVWFEPTGVGCTPH